MTMTIETTAVEPKTERVPSMLCILDILGILARDLCHEILGLDVAQWGSMSDEGRAAFRKIGATIYREGILKAAAMLGCARRDFLSPDKGAGETRVALDALGRMLADEVADVSRLDVMVVFLRSEMRVGGGRRAHD